MKKFISDELREDAKEVFLDSYPAEDDVLGWLKLKQDDFFNNHTFKGAIALIEQLQEDLVEETEARRELDKTVNTYLNETKKLRKDLAEREAENLKLKDAMKTINHSMSQALITGNDRMREIQLSQVVSHEALSTPQSTSYLEQWEKSKYGEPILYMLPKGDRGYLKTHFELCHHESLIPLYARKD